MHASARWVTLQLFNSAGLRLLRVAMAQSDKAVENEQRLVALEERIKKLGHVDVELLETSVQQMQSRVAGLEQLAARVGEPPEALSRAQRCPASSLRTAACAQETRGHP